MLSMGRGLKGLVSDGASERGGHWRGIAALDGSGPLNCTRNAGPSGYSVQIGDAKDSSVV